MESNLGFIDTASVRKREGQQRKRERAKRSRSSTGTGATFERKPEGGGKQLPRGKAGASTCQEVCLVSMKSSREASKAARGRNGGSSKGTSFFCEAGAPGFGEESQAEFSLEEGLAAPQGGTVRIGENLERRAGARLTDSVHSRR